MLRSSYKVERSFDWDKANSGLYFEKWKSIITHLRPYPLEVNRKFTCFKIRWYGVYQPPKPGTQLSLFD